MTAFGMKKCENVLAQSVGWWGAWSPFLSNPHPLPPQAFQRALGKKAKLSPIES